MTVLVADDSAVSCEQITVLLSELDGVEVIGRAHDAPGAYQAVRRLSPDVITLDIQLAGGSGIDVLKKIRREGRAPVVIMLTNCASLPYRKRCREAGADFFVDKSTEFGRVREIIRALAGRFGPAAGGAGPPRPV